MALNWQPAKLDRKSVYADGADGRRWTITEGKFGNETVFYLKDCCAEVAILNSLDEAKQDAERL